MYIHAINSVDNAASKLCGSRNVFISISFNCYIPVSHFGCHETKLTRDLNEEAAYISYRVIQLTRKAWFDQVDNQTIFALLLISQEMI